MPVRFALCLFVCVALLSPSHDAEARKSRRRSKRSTQRSSAPQTTKQVKVLLGNYKWGATMEQVMTLLSKEVRAKYKSALEKETDPIEQDRLRKEVQIEIAKLRANKISFRGKATPWDVSLIDKEFVHRNGESLLVRWGRRDRRFYFFHRNRLWKIYIAFNSGLYKDKTFADFAGLMEHRFGPAERKHKTSLTGTKVLSHLQWPPVGDSALRAIDNTEFYGNFCLVITHRERAKDVLSGRKGLVRTTTAGDPLIQAVMRKDEKTGHNQNEDIVDRITGRGIRTPNQKDSAE